MRLLPCPVIGGLALLAVAAACGGDSDNGLGVPGPIPPSAANVVIVSGASTKGFQAYSPDTFTVAAGGEVTWRNDDGLSHTVTDTTAANAFAITLGSGGDTASVVFTIAGEYPYKCSIHPGMRGLVVVNP